MLNEKIYVTLDAWKENKNKQYLAKVSKIMFGCWKILSGCFGKRI